MFRRYGTLPLVVAGLALLAGAITALASSGGGLDDSGLVAQEEVCETPSGSPTATASPNGSPTATATPSEDEDEIED